MDTPPRRILVADDDHDTADLTAELLRLDGYEVLAVYDGHEALAAARTFRPHLVILDIDMPAMDGCEAAPAIRAESIDARMVLVAHTAQNLPAALDRIRRAGFDRYLRKPAAHGALGVLMAECLLASRARSEGLSRDLANEPFAP